MADGDEVTVSVPPDEVITVSVTEAPIVLSTVAAPADSIEVALEPSTLVEVATGVTGPRGEPGETGDQGPMGPTGGTFVHAQVEPASVWPIVHGLGMHPNVTVIDSAGSVVLGDVVYVSPNEVQLVFSAAFAGTAHLS